MREKSATYLNILKSDHYFEFRLQVGSVSVTEANIVSGKIERKIFSHDYPEVGQYCSAVLTFTTKGISQMAGPRVYVYVRAHGKNGAVSESYCIGVFQIDEITKKHGTDHVEYSCTTYGWAVLNSADDTPYDEYVEGNTFPVTTVRAFQTICSLKQFDADTDSVSRLTAKPYSVPNYGRYKGAVPCLDMLKMIAASYGGNVLIRDYITPETASHFGAIRILPLMESPGVLSGDVIGAYKAVSLHESVWSAASVDTSGNNANSTTWIRTGYIQGNNFGSTGDLVKVTVPTGKQVWIAQTDNMGNTGFTAIPAHPSNGTVSNEIIFTNNAAKYYRIVAGSGSNLIDNRFFDNISLSVASVAHYDPDCLVGKSARDINSSINGKKFTGVKLYDDGSETYTAGTETGDVLIVNTRIGTQQIANDIYSGLSGKEYKGILASGAQGVDPLIELGDPISIDGVDTIVTESTLVFGDGAVQSTIGSTLKKENNNQATYSQKTGYATNESLGNGSSVLDLKEITVESIIFRDTNGNEYNVRLLAKGNASYVLGF